MKRIGRDPGKFEVLNLFAALGRQEGLVLGDKESEAKFLDRISASLLCNKNNQALLHGLRTEDLFQYVAASLGKCLLIKKEDAGDIASTEKIQPPDYLLVLHDKTRFFVEVKNCHKKQPPCNFSFKEAYLDKLLKYADIVGNELKIAIYWSAFNLWTLISPSQFERSKGKCSVTIPSAMKVNEMNRLGDFSVGTTPPLILRIVADKNKPRSIASDGLAKFTIGSIEFLCCEKKITNKREQQYAFYFMLYGDWQLTEPIANIEDNKPISIDYIAEPEQRTPSQNFELFGFISSMISRWYRALVSTSSSGEKLSIAVEPNALGINIPSGYKGKDMPLWQFHIHPNFGKSNKTK